MIPPVLFIKKPRWRKGAPAGRKQKHNLPDRHRRAAMIYFFLSVGGKAAATAFVPEQFTPRPVVLAALAGATGGNPCRQLLVANLFYHIQSLTQWFVIGIVSLY